MDSMKSVTTGSQITHKPRVHKKHEKGAATEPKEQVSLGGDSSSGVSARSLKFASAVSPLKDVPSDAPANAIPLDEHLKQATGYILDRTNEEYQGFIHNDEGNYRKAHQIASHLKDMMEFVKSEGKVDVPSLSKKEEKQLVDKASGFVADRIGDEFGMQPHMRRNPFFMSPIQHNISDYLQFLRNEQLTLTAGNKGAVTVTKN